MALTYSNSKIAVLTLSVVAAANLEANRAVGQNGNYASQGDHCLGMTDSAGAIGENTAVDVLGTSYATSGAAITVDQLLQVGTDGKLIPKASGKAVARAMSAASGADETIDILLLPANS